jgi:hypothetical protein
VKAKVSPHEREIMNIVINKKILIIIGILGVLAIAYSVCFVLVPGPQHLDNLWEVLTGHYYEYANPPM